MDRTMSWKIILLLALVQGIAGLLRAFNWVLIGVDLFGEGLLLLPFVGALAVMRGLVISVVALLYVLFVIGALLGSHWAWWVCLTAVVINLLLVLNGLIQGAAVIQAVIWAVIPAILLFYFFSQTGRNTLEGR